MKRAISGIFFVAVVVGATIFSRYSFFAVFLLLMVVCMSEFYRLILKIKSCPQTLLGIIIGTVIFCWCYAFTTGIVEAFTGYIMVALVMAVFIIELFRAKQKPIHNIAFTLLGIVYVAVPFSLLNFVVINDDAYSAQYLLAMLFMVWGNDTGAYIFGVSMGKHKLFPRISPKKSWEGFIGGVIFTAIVAYLLSLVYTKTSLTHWLFLGAVACVFAVLGDLVESMFKRAVGVKDSGKFMPGHGGALDRFDALIMVIPAYYIFLKLLCLI